MMRKPWEHDRDCLYVVSDGPAPCTCPASYFNDTTSIELHVLAFLIERRLTENEAVAVIKVLKGDSSIGWLAGYWLSPWSDLPAISQSMVHDLVCRKVIAWMNKYHEGHRARAMFTGES